ncbi:MAG: Fe-S protein assembly chaperone HscA [Myxococcota bacterium]
MALMEIFDPAAGPRPVGIDLGTTNSVVARMRDDQPVPILDCDLQALVPSVVFYDKAGRIVVGGEALRMATADPQHTIVSVKRFMGRGADDPETRRLGTAVFVAPETEEERRTVRFQLHGEVKTPVEVSAEILKALRQRAEDELRHVGGVVITVPAYFDDAQRQATKDAGKLAGLDVLRLLNEPTAAALAYGLDKKQNGLFAVYDLGGGTFDITVLRLDDGVFQVKSTGGNSALGGDDMDRALAEELLSNMDIEPDATTVGGREVIRIALDAARQAKHALTDAEQVVLNLPKKGGGDVDITVTRSQFEALIEPIVARTGIACRRALRDAGVAAGEIDGVILVGGSTRVPLVRRFVAETFAQPPLTDIDPDYVVAMGAAIQADILAGGAAREGEVLLLDVLPLSLGLETMGGVAEKILPRNTTIPAGARQVFTTYADNQTGFELHVVQGERELAEDCRSLAKFYLKGIPPMAAGSARLEVTFRVDADGLLKVSAEEVTTGVAQEVEVKPSYGLTDEEVERMLLEALDHGEEDFEKRKLAERRVEGRRILAATHTALERDASLLDGGEREQIDAAMERLAEAIAGTRPGIILTAIEALDDTTKAWAGRRMDAAIAGALQGQSVDSVERDVGHARGVDAHVEEHRRRREGHADVATATPAGTAAPPTPMSPVLQIGEPADP